jgi:adenylate cyclase
VPLAKAGPLLGVRHILKGRVGRVGGSPRIQAEQYDAAQETQIWSQEFMAPLHDVLSLQDEVVEAVLSLLGVSPTPTEFDRIHRVSTANWSAYDAYLLGRGSLFRPTRQNVLGARRSFERAVELEPAYAAGLAGLSETFATAAQLGYARTAATAVRRARQFAEDALAADDSLPAAHRALASAAFLSGEHDLAVSALLAAVDLAPNDAKAQIFLGFYLAWAGRGIDAVTPIEKSIRLNPFSEGPDKTFLGFAYSSARRFGEAIDVFVAEKEAGNPMSAFALTHWTAALVGSQRTAEAQAVAQEIMAAFPTFTLSAWAATLRYKDEADAERHLDALREAGLPN